VGGGGGGMGRGRNGRGKGVGNLRQFFAYRKETFLLLESVINVCISAYFFAK
jgi:hypothetical protein